MGGDCKGALFAVQSEFGEEKVAPLIATLAQYSVDAALGQVKVEIRVPKVVGEKKLYDGPNSTVKQLKAESLPAKHNDQTELQFDVTPGEMRQDYDLSTK